MKNKTPTKYYIDGRGIVKCTKDCKEFVVEFSREDGCPFDVCPDDPDEPCLCMSCALCLEIFGKTYIGYIGIDEGDTR